ncbi:hypothetical protein [Burkholderia sp. BDU5]|nr:hypothetical protein [Burkholderia sp. BDU5]
MRRGRAAFALFLLLLRVYRAVVPPFIAARAAKTTTSRFRHMKIMTFL